MQGSTTDITYDFMQGVSLKYLYVKYGKWYFLFYNLKKQYDSEVLLYVCGLFSVSIVITT